MNLVEELRNQLLYHEEQIRAIKVVLEGQSKVYESSISSIINLNDMRDIVVRDMQDMAIDKFPYNKSKRHQILWLFENVLKKASRMPEIQLAYEKHTGNNDDITMTVRMLKNIPVVGTAKRTYGGDVNNKTFWGLSSWYSGEDFLPDFHPYG